jgi:hypothetical protein
MNNQMERRVMPVGTKPVGASELKFPLIRARSWFLFLT